MTPASVRKASKWYLAKQRERKAEQRVVSRAIRWFRESEDQTLPWCGDKECDSCRLKRAVRDLLSARRKGESKP